MKNILPTLMVILFMPSILWASEIVLKSGQVVEGKIIEKTAYHIKIYSSSGLKTYSIDDVNSIDGHKFGMDSDSSNQEAVNQPSQDISQTQTAPPVLAQALSTTEKIKALNVQDKQEIVLLKVQEEHERNQILNDDEYKELKNKERQLNLKYEQYLQKQEPEFRQRIQEGDPKAFLELDESNESKGIKQELSDVQQRAQEYFQERLVAISEKYREKIKEIEDDYKGKERLLIQNLHN